MSIPDLQPSKLGTKKHWDEVYSEEITNFNDHQDEGEIWFGQETVDKMVNWALANDQIDRNNMRILEVGSGNGTLLFGFAKKDYPLESLFGIDYSEGAIKLAKSISEARGYQKISFNHCDFLNEDPPLPQTHQDSSLESWDLILDKGTFDAIALMQKEEDGTAPVSKYPQRIARLLKPGAYFLITSCNFTESELQTAFSVTPELEYHSRIQHPVYTFRGRSGSICASVAFQKSVAKN
ncbi:S-adenosyl-L-methionine-dependent methyltransferase [Hygrophoropsis aurantiaca]|uniref:S-adenosyl-L-methionine-dependent methyltransferase n=1 Tax=Hygrophoropsis aurantiaca TaxID=72124 RepID=A0ACB8AJY6_9AGAM|nr:S-adenosyl-L-methionine-dependent methyltransferase [Hygrophoropsis aurantiaca]